MSSQVLPPAQYPELVPAVDKLSVSDDKYEFDSLTPYFPDIKWDKLEKIEVTDKALNADPSYKHLLAAIKEAGATVTHVTPKIGTIIEGFDLATLTDAQKDEFALLLAHRGAVFIKGQKDFTVKQQIALGKYWGHLHQHATTALPKGLKEDPELENIHVVYSAPGGDDKVRKLSPAVSFSQTYLWHSDVSYELQPPSYTSLKLLDGPEVGGDTLWTSGYALYDALSPGLQKYLEGLTALHSAVEQAQDARRYGNPVRREPVVSEHPIVRTHPITKLKAVYVNPGFTRTIVGVPKGESDAILKYLFNLIATAQEHTVRFKWSPGDIAFWDNRVTTHTATYGFYPARRHAIRVTVTGEAPTYDAAGLSQQDELDRAAGVSPADIDVRRGGNYND